MIQKCAGILFYRRRSGTDDLEFFLVSPGGPAWRNRYAWAPPKGHMEDTDRDAWEAARREFEEETGVPVPETELPDKEPIIFKQRKDKEVTLFVIDYNESNVEIDTGKCFSNLFEWEDGNEYPEIEHYEWLTYDEVKEYVVRAYGEIIKQLIDELC